MLVRLVMLGLFLVLIRMLVMLSELLREKKLGIIIIMIMPEMLCLELLMGIMPFKLVLLVILMRLGMLFQLFMEMLSFIFST